MIVSPGAPAQTLHSDSSWLHGKAALTCFVALHDVCFAHGPTVMFPFSHHVPEAHREEERAKIRRAAERQMLGAAVEGAHRAAEGVSAEGAAAERASAEGASAEESVHRAAEGASVGESVHRAAEGASAEGAAAERASAEQSAQASQRARPPTPRAPPDILGASADELEHVDYTLAIPCLLKKGDCVVMDSRLLHYGSENCLSSKRSLFYFSLHLAGGAAPVGSTLTLKNCYQQKLWVRCEV